MPTSVNGNLQIDEKYANLGQRIWFCTPNGGGSGKSWDSPCTFREAISGTSNTILDVIYLSPGNHDCDNESDATGTEISTQYNQIIGVSNNRHDSVLVNADAAPTNILTISAANNAINNCTFFEDETIELNIRADDCILGNCDFKQSAGASGTGILLDNSCEDIYIRDVNFYNLVSYGIRINGAAELDIRECLMKQCSTSISIEGANDNFINVRDCVIADSTTGVNISGANTSDIIFKDITFIHNTTNISDSSGSYDNAHWQDTIDGHAVEEIVPTTTGTTINTGDGAWVWTTNPTTIISADSIITPFIITGINIQSYDASQTYKIQLFYGESTANIVSSIFEFTVGTTIANQKININLPGNTAIPANSIVGVKLMSSTAGVDSVVATMSYIAL